MSAVAWKRVVRDTVSGGAEIGGRVRMRPSIFCGWKKIDDAPGERSLSINQFVESGRVFQFVTFFEGG